MLWKFTGDRPVYQQIMEQIRSATLAGTYSPGARIPPVRDLATEAKVNPNTMQRALMELEREGLLVSCGTIGRFVTDDPVILERTKNAAIHTAVRASAAQFRALGLTMEQAAAMLLALQQEESNG